MAQWRQGNTSRVCCSTVLLEVSVRSFVRMKEKRIASQYISELTVSSKNMTPIIRFRDMAHYTTNF
jgi:hypothetical protein